MYLSRFLHKLSPRNNSGFPVLVFHWKSKYHFGQLHKERYRKAEEEDLHF